MNYSEFTSELSKRLQLSKTDVSKRMKHFAEILSSELQKENTVSLGNLGTLKVHQRNERICVNPSSGKRMLVPPKLIVKFKVSNSLKEKVKALYL